MNTLVTIIFLLGGNIVLVTSQRSTLELVHVVFRHGDRNPDDSGLWDSNPYYNESFYREGYGQLTNAGKRTEYRLGQLLRQRYSSFLGSEWNINYLDVRSTDTNRTKMSALLVLGGLWPPQRRDVWLPFFNWLPIPYNYIPTLEDKELLAYAACSNLLTEMANVLAEENIATYIQERYNETFEILTQNTGRSGSLYNAFAIYLGILVQEELGFPPQEWTQAIYPEPLHSAAVDLYYIVTNNTMLRKLSAGFLLRKILTDSGRKIDGSINPSSRKMFMYSAHEMNIATFLLSLEAYKITDVPPYGGYVLVELHRIRGVYGFKLFYQNYEQRNPIPLKLPNCDYFCPYDDFYEKIQEILPEDTDCNISDSNYHTTFGNVIW